MTQIEWHSEMYSNTNVNTNTNINSKVNINDNINDNININSKVNINDKINDNVNSNININSKVNISNNTTIGNAANSSTPDSWELRNNQKIYHGNPDRGYVVPIANENFCITPGLTVGYGVGVTHTDESVPRYMHTKLYPSLHHKYKFCHSEADKHSPRKGPCLERMGGVNKTPGGKTTFAIHAVRSRTLTSAGMDGVGNSDVHDRGKIDTEIIGAVSPASNQSNAAAALSAAAAAASPSNTTTEETGKTKEKADRMEVVLWKVLKEKFEIDLEEVKRTQKFLNDNRLEIAVENSLGQCSTGHSCKDKARERLEKIVESQSEKRAL
jgi:hypothetical protein